ncbi:MAG: class I SAM-dependent methyltransferase [Bacteroidetes bacterium]|nr:class I SAM-dependent methyltransferase [Bacteroidota bacterium]
MNALIKKQAFFDEVVPRWILDTEERSTRLYELFMRFDLPLIGPILDVGAGAGILLPLLRRFAPAAPIVELEVSMEMLRMARILHASLNDVTYVLADGHRLPFPDAHFGSIHCFSVFPHLHDRTTAIGELHRGLRPGGHLCILHLMGHEQLNDLHRDAGRVVADDVLPPVGVLADILRPAGFDITHAEERPDLYLLLATAR